MESKAANFMTPTGYNDWCVIGSNKNEIEMASMDFNHDIKSELTKYLTALQINKLVSLYQHSQSQSQTDAGILEQNLRSFVELINDPAFSENNLNKINSLSRLIDSLAQTPLLITNVISAVQISIIELKCLSNNRNWFSNAVRACGEQISPERLIRAMVCEDQSFPDTANDVNPALNSLSNAEAKPSAAANSDPKTNETQNYLKTLVRFLPPVFIDHIHECEDDKNGKSSTVVCFMCGVYCVRDTRENSENSYRLAERADLTDVLPSIKNQQDKLKLGAQLIKQACSDNDIRAVNEIFECFCAENSENETAKLLAEKCFDQLKQLDYDGADFSELIKLLGFYTRLFSQHADQHVALLQKRILKAFTHCDSFKHWCEINQCCLKTIGRQTFEDLYLKTSLQYLTPLVADINYKVASRLLELLCSPKREGIRVGSGEHEFHLLKLLSRDSPLQLSQTNQQHDDLEEFLKVLDEHLNKENTDILNKNNKLLPLFAAIQIRIYDEISGFVTSGNAELFAISFPRLYRYIDIQGELAQKLIDAVFKSGNSDIILTVILSESFKTVKDLQLKTSQLTPYFYLISQGKLDLCQALIKARPELKTQKMLDHHTAFHIACEYGRLDCVKWCLDNADDKKELLLEKDINDCSALALAVSQSRLDIAEFLCENYPYTLFWRNQSSGQNLLHIAVESRKKGNKNDDIIRLLMDKAPRLLHDDDIQQQDAKTPIALALESFSYDELRDLFLSSAVFGINKAVFNDLPALAYVMSIKRDDLANQLICDFKQQLDFNFTTPSEGNTYLHLAAGCPKSFENIAGQYQTPSGQNNNVMDHDALREKLQQRNKAGWQPYHQVAAAGNIDVLETVMAFADKNLINRQALTRDKKNAVIIAIEHGDLITVKRLLNNGVLAVPFNVPLSRLLFICARHDNSLCLIYFDKLSNIKAQFDIFGTEDQLNLLQVAVRHNAKDVAGYLMNHHSELYSNARQRGCGPLIMAVEHKSHSTLEQLLKYEVAQSDVSCDQAGLTACHIAVDSDDGDSLELLMKHKVLAQARVKSTTSAYYNHTPLLMAASCGKHKALEVIMASLSPHEIRHQKLQGMNAAHLAAKNGHCECLRLLSPLRDERVNNKHLTCEGYSPLHFAAQFNQLQAIHTLIQLGADLNNSSKYKHSIKITPLITAYLYNKTDAADILLTALAAKKQKRLLLKNDMPWTFFSDYAKNLCKDYNSPNNQLITALYYQ